MTEKVSTKNIGIIRHRFNDFLKAKGKKVVTKKRFSKTTLRKTYEDEDLVKSSLLNNSTKASEIQLNEFDELIWMPDYRKCCHLLNQIDEIAQDIKREKAKKLSAINEDKHQKVIEKLSQEASTKINRCEKILKGIQNITQINSNPQERKIFTNVLMSLAMKIRDKAKSIRYLQQEDLRERQELKQFYNPQFQPTGLMNKDEFEGEQFTEENFNIFQQKLNEQRNEEIMKIVTSIHSLNTIYKDLQMIVIEQGSLLDRIDENIENTAFNIKQANEHLVKAEEYQKSPIANRILCILVTLIFICAMILFLR